MGQIVRRLGPVTTAILIAGAILQAFFILAHGANKELLGDGTFLALNEDDSVPSWATVVLFGYAGASCALLAWLRPGWRWPLLILAALAFLLSLESTAQIHGDVESSSGNPFRSLVEVLGGLGVVAVLGLAARALPRPFDLLLLIAMAAIAISAGSSEMNDKFHLPYAGVIFFQTLEEVGEMTTAILILAATLEPLLAALASRLRPGDVEGSVRLVGGVSRGS